MSPVIPVLMSGGTGSRLWPLSREAYPKQLLPLLGQGSLLQETLQRVTGSSLFGAPLVVANAEHRFLIAEQLRETGCTEATIILEPFGRILARRRRWQPSWPRDRTQTASFCSCRPITVSETYLSFGLLSRPGKKRRSGEHLCLSASHRPLPLQAMVTSIVGKALTNPASNACSDLRRSLTRTRPRPTWLPAHMPGTAASSCSRHAASSKS